MQTISILDALTKALTTRADQVLIVAAKEINKNKININIINNTKKEDEEKEDNSNKYVD